MNFEKILYEVKDELAYIGFGYKSDKKMNVLDQATLEELKNIVSSIKSSVDSGKIKGIILHSLTPGCFLAGVDINLIASLKSEAEVLSTVEEGHSIFNMLEDLKIPKIACIDGVCMGGGLEVALTCDKILATDSDKTMFALPEVKLGLLPGLGGTYRLPRRIGIPNALDMILTGKNIRAKKAKRMGLVTEVYAKEKILEMAKVQLFKKGRKLKKAEKIQKMIMSNFLVKKLIFQKARESVLKKTKGFYHAPLKILEVIESGSLFGRKTYLSKEANAFAELTLSDQSKNLRHIFFLMEGSKKYKGESIGADVRKLKKGAVLGAGTMGGGIAWLLSDFGMAPILKDINTDALELGLKQSASVYRKSVKRRHITPAEFERKQRSICPQLNYDGFKSTDLVIEAIVEKMDIKKSVFKELENEVNDKTIISSNTSSLSVGEMSTALSKPERFIGLHFFNPVSMMPLVEIITHEKVSEEVVKEMHAWAVRVKKTPIIVNDGPGFLVNRILGPFLNESVYLLEEGLSIEDLDKAIESFGMPMGPCRLLDEVGFDIALHASEIMSSGLGERLTQATLLKEIINAGFLGKKNKKGFYHYDGRGKKLEINDSIKKFGPKKKIKMTNIEIQKRIILPMINEAAHCLQDGIVSDADTVDIGLIFGIGFPPFRGGLLKYADSEGVDKMLESLKELEEKVDSKRYKPCQYFIDLVNNKQNFYN